MSTIDRLDSILEAPYNQEHDPDNPVIDWDDSKGPDPRLLRLSYSSSTLFHGCPRKYQLLKLKSTPSPEQEEDWRRTLTFQFGHTVGDGIQKTLLYGSTEVSERQRIILELFQEWKCDLFDENERQKKSFFHALAAVAKFWGMQDEGFFSEYKLAYYDGKPAVELSFKVIFPSGESYRGYVDAVLVNKDTGEYVILELKTNSGRMLNYNQYRNSAQALGYSVVLDRIAPKLTNYTVEYLVYMTWLERWEQFSFPKTYAQRALWVRDRLWEAQQIQLLHEQEGSYGIWPMHGEHCVTFGRPCEFLGVCHMQTEGLVEKLKARDLIDKSRNLHEEDYQFIFHLEELL